MNETKAVVERDPQADVTRLLTEAGHPWPQAWEGHLKLLAPAALDKTTDVEWRRRMINRVMHVYINGLSHPSTDYLRSMLCDQDSYDVWFRMFSKGVAPALAKLAKGELK